MVLVAAAVSVLALSAAPAAATTDPQPTVVRIPATAVNAMKVLTPQRAAGWDCDPGFSCYYTGLDGTGSRWRAPSCGWFTLEGSFLQNNLYSIHNLGNGRVDVYNSIGGGSYELKGWVDPRSLNWAGRGNFHENIGADLINIYC
ncbi:peptidase inhibitor family I36 protein [Actinomadura mexicana]|nr:peptidase inhibitor family I36 protein [Actinomadura mexicana]